MSNSSATGSILLSSHLNPAHSHHFVFLKGCWLVHSYSGNYSDGRILRFFCETLGPSYTYMWDFFYKCFTNTHQQYFNINFNINFHLQSHEQTSGDVEWRLNLWASGQNVMCGLSIKLNDFCIFHWNTRFLPLPAGGVRFSHEEKKRNIFSNATCLA